MGNIFCLHSTVTITVQSDPNQSQYQHASFRGYKANSATTFMGSIVILCAGYKSLTATNMVSSPL